ncbi:MAG: hypothetical protein R3C01_03585 [Planctomycetaceae bacterium]
MAMKRVLLSAVLLAASPLFADDAGRPAELFKKLDKDGDSQLTRDEIPEEQVRFFERLVRVGDKNEDGKLTADEFAKGLTSQEPPRDVPREGTLRGEGPAGARPDGRPQFQPGEMFKRWDSNQDGKVTLDELPEAARERMKPLFERLGKDSFTQADLERLRPQGDGAQARPDKAAMIARLKEMDSNGDGKLTPQEAPERFKERINAVLERTGGDSVDIESVVALIEREGDRPRPEGARPDGDRPRPEGAREGDRPRPEGAREGDRPRPEGQPREGDRPRPEGGPRDGERPGSPPPRPAFFRAWDSNNDGRLSREEVEKAAQSFKQLDTNNDGFLDPQELMGGPRPRPEGDRPRPEGAREGDRPRPEGAREGDRPRPEGAREGDRPRPEGERK